MLNNYSFKEKFDVNLTLSYENDMWDEWHILREFISNALDSAQNDRDKINITTEDNFIKIKDSGDGYPIVFAKRIGASSKKGDESSIGMFGEGTKLAILTCIRKGIKIMVASQDWLILPKAESIEGQAVLMYDVYEGPPIEGSIVAIEATDNIRAITDNLSLYFLSYNKESCLAGDYSSGIYSTKDNISKLYNKGVYIKDIDALFSYGISIERLNRDRDLVSYSDICYGVRDIWENVQDLELIKQFISAGTGGERENCGLVEFYLSLTPSNRELWKQAFHELYGESAVLATNDIAAREAEALGFRPIKLNHETKLTLLACGVVSDVNCLADDYEFEWSRDLSGVEHRGLDKLCLYAASAGLAVPSSIKIYDRYKQNDNIPGLYSMPNKEVYLRRDTLSQEIERSLPIFLHELNHHATETDDISREFAENLCQLLSYMIIKYVTEVGTDGTVRVQDKGLELPPDSTFSARGMKADVSLIGNQMIVNTPSSTITLVLDNPGDTCGVWSRKVKIEGDRFIISLPLAVKTVIGEGEFSCKIK